MNFENWSTFGKVLHSSIEAPLLTHMANSPVFVPPCVDPVPNFDSKY